MVAFASDLKVKNCQTLNFTASTIINFDAKLTIIEASLGKSEGLFGLFTRIHLRIL